MSKRQLVIMWISIALLIATWIFPPWIYSVKQFGGVQYVTRWALLFDPNHGGQLGYQTLLLENAIIVALSAGLIISLRKSS